MGKAAQATASALLRGARGNSGVILSLLFRGFAKAIKERETMDGRDLAIALDFGVAAAYKAVMKPAEGTILTVSRLAAARAAGAAREDNCFEAVLEAAIQEGQLALADTVNQNPVLKKAGVVDAGGAGFLLILQGMLNEVRGEEMPADEEPAQAEKADFGAIPAEDITFAFDTVFIVRKPSPNVNLEPFLSSHRRTHCSAAMIMFLLLGRTKTISAGVRSISLKMSSVEGFMVWPPEITPSTPRSLNTASSPAPAHTAT